MIFWGGSWYWVALLLAIYNVYEVGSFLSEVYSLLKEVIATDVKTQEKSIFMAARRLFMLFVIFYAVWTVPFLARITMAITLQKYIIQNVMGAIFYLMDKIRSERNAFGGLLRLTIVTAIASVLLMCLFEENIQACFLMACHGTDTLFLAAPESFIASAKIPKMLDRKVILLSVILVISMTWQFLSGFQCSFLGFVVPLGFLF